MRVQLAIGLVLLVPLLAGCAGPSPAGEDGGGDEGASTLPAEADVVYGRLTAAASQQTIEMPIEALGHERLAVVLVLATNAPENELEVEVTGPGNRTAEGDTGPFLYAFPGPRPTMSFGDPPAGAWTAAVSLASGSVADFELHWCADGEEAPGPQANLACHRAY